MKKIIGLVLSSAIFFMMVGEVPAGWFDDTTKSVNKKIGDLNRAIGGVNRSVDGINRSVDGINRTKKKIKTLKGDKNPSARHSSTQNQNPSGVGVGNPGYTPSAQKEAVGSDFGNHRQEATIKYSMLELYTGMPVAEAEKFVRQHLDVGAVYEYDERNKTSSNNIYPFAKIFESRNKKEAIALYSSPWRSDLLSGASRSKIYEEPQRSAIEASLAEKYGKPVRSGLWGDFSGVDWICRSFGNTKNEFSSEYLNNVEGDGPLDILSRLRGSFSIIKGVSLETSVTTRKLQTCLPTVTATFGKSKSGSVVTIAIFDHTIALENFLSDYVARKQKAADAREKQIQNKDPGMKF